MMKYVFLAFAVFLGCYVHSQKIPQHRIYKWSEVSTTFNHSDKLPILHASDFGMNGTDSTDISDALQELIDMLNGRDGGIIYVPKGDYFLNKTLQLKSNVSIIGEGSDTRLHFNVGEAHAIRAAGKKLPWNLELRENANLKDSFLIKKTAATVTKGDLIKIGIINHDEAYSDWAKNAVAQIVEVKKVSGDTIFLDEELRLALSKDKLMAERIKPIKNVEISCLSIISENSTKGQKSNIRFDYVSRSKISGVQSFKGNFAHVDIRNSFNVKVTSSYFKNAHKHGNGGQGYGVVLQFSTSSSLVEDNIFEKLRHSILLQAGANGNVLAYNYSVEPFWTDVSLPEDAAGELVLHGNYNFANLFEGNEVGNIVIDFSHGKNGYHNTFINNTATNYGLLANPGPAADSLNLWHNRMTNTSFLKGNFIVYGENNSLSGNKKGNKLTENNSSIDAIESLYLNSDETADKDAELAAKTRFNEGVYTICDAFDAPEEKSTSVTENSSEMIVYPNPSSNVVKIKTEISGELYIQLFSLNGMMLKQKSGRSIQVDDIDNGMYILKIVDSNGLSYSQKLHVQ